MDTLTTILSVPAVVAIVELLKSFGVAGKWALLAALVVGTFLLIPFPQIALFLPALMK